MPQIEESEEYSIVPPSSVPHGEDDVDDYVPEPEIIQNYYEEEEEWRYNPNHSRGAQLMNGYDRNALNYEYPKGDAYLPKWQVIFQKLLYVSQIMMCVGAGIIMCGAYVAERNGWNFSEANGIIFGKMEDELIYVPYAAGIMSGITAFIGCTGAKSRNKCGSCMLVIYMLFLGISLCLSFASMFQGFADKGNVFKYAQRQWDQLTATQEKIFEWEHFCCNFKAMDPCCRFTYGENECVNEYVCFEKVEPHLLEQFEIIIISSMLHTIYLFILMLLSAGLYCYMTFKSKRHLNKKGKKGSGEPVPDY
eukprot:103408_1